MVKTLRESVGHPSLCTEDLCRSSFRDCPDLGSHNNEGGQVKAEYHDCTCRCCKEGECGADGTDLQTDTYFAGKPELCSRGHCSSNFYNCPEVGEGRVLALYHDCMCSCAVPGEALRYSTYYAGSPELCSPDQCSSRYYQCPDPGAHNSGAIVEASYSGAYPPPLPSPPPPSTPPTPPPQPFPPPPKLTYHIDNKAATLPTYAVVLIILLAVGLALGLAFVGYRRYAQEKAGFRWVMFDGVEELPVNSVELREKIMTDAQV